jgi:hypothetical protein
VSATEETGAVVTLTATDLPPGASFVDDRDNTGSFSWTPPIGGAGTYRIAFHAEAPSARATRRTRRSPSSRRHRRTTSARARSW